MSSLVQQIQQIIEAQYQQPLSGESVAKLVGRRTQYVCARFAEETGLTIHQSLTEVRMREAARLLMDGHKAYSVASLVGYKSRKDFYCHFRRSYRVTPGAYAASIASDKSRV